MAVESDSINQQLRSLVNKEFSNYECVPSLAEASMFDLLYLCFPDVAEQPDKSWLGTTFKKTFSWNNLSDANSDSRSPGNFVSLGWLFDYCPENNLNVRRKEEPVYNHGPISGSNVVTRGLKGRIPSVCEGEASASFEDKDYLNLGEIRKASLCYKEVAYLISKITAENSPELFKEAKSNKLFIIYDVLSAEHLEINNQEKAEVSCQGSITAKNAGGSGTWKRNSRKGSRLSRPKSMGRYPFAFKCGQVRVKKNKKHLGLVAPKEFHKPFQVRDQSEQVVLQSQTSSLDDEASNEPISFNVKSEMVETSE